MKDTERPACRPAAAVDALPPMRFLFHGTSSEPPLILVDEGQDFEAIYTAWCAQDDAFCEDRIDVSEWDDIVTFLRKHNVTIIEPAAIDELGEFYE